MTADNLTWHPGAISRSDRETIKNHKGACLWFTGLSGSGKSTLANELEAALNARGVHTYILDGDNIRHGLNRDLGFTDAARTENIRRIGEVAKLFVDAGIIVLTAFISPFIRDRDFARNLMSEGDFIEIFVDADLATCERRDPKGLYTKARSGEIRDFTGIDSPYEPPLRPELTIRNNDDADIADNVRIITLFLEEKGIL
ncbi:MAG: adenylyl-sulfate kinase [delta proteobacterium MLS_D]|jgi:adenylylsulfate kinase|nr:MAG: adenylyl-sulfate kinase [delta proteobacterium MLS_D]